MEEQWPQGSQVALTAGTTYHRLLATAYEEALAAMGSVESAP